MKEEIASSWQDFEKIFEQIEDLRQKVQGGLRGLSLRGNIMRMHNPPHPGEIIKSLCLEPLGVTVTQAAEALGVSRKTPSAILMVAQGSARKWLCVSPWRLTPLLKVG